MSTVYIDPARSLGVASEMLYGQFIEHFYKQIYGGIFDPDSPLSDEDGLRMDVLEAMRRLRIPILRWPGGCFVSDYHWKDGVGKTRTPVFNRAWRVLETNRFGTEEFIKLCKKIGAKPYICTNAGTGTPEEMADWVEYCNNDAGGQWSKLRRENGSDCPHGVKHWSIGNENWSHGEIGRKSVEEWGRFVRESAKMMLRVDPTIELSAASIVNPEWNLRLLDTAGDLLRWISVHEYWDEAWEENNLMTYEQAMCASTRAENSIRKMEGLLTACGCEQRIQIAFDEWNLRGWHHPGVFNFSKLIPNAHECEAYREKNENNSDYTMADAVFSACFLNGCFRHAKTVGMANFAPIVSTRGAISVGKTGIVLRPTYYVFLLYRQHLYSHVIDIDQRNAEVFTAEQQSIKALDIVATRDDAGHLSISVINRDPEHAITLTMICREGKWNGKLVHYVLNGSHKDAYNDFDRPNDVMVTAKPLQAQEDSLCLTFAPHSVNIISQS